MLLLLLLLRRRVMLLAAADGHAGLVELLQTLLVVLVTVRLEMMRLLGMKSEVVSAVKQGHLDHGGPVKARLARGAPALEGLQAAVRTPLLSAHLRGARPFVCGLLLSVHPGQVSRRGGVAVCWCDRQLRSAKIRSVTVCFRFPHARCDGGAHLLTRRRSNPQPGAPTPRLLQREMQAGLVRRCLPLL